MPRRTPKQVRFDNNSIKLKVKKENPFTIRNDGYDWASILFEELTGKSYKTFFKSIGTTFPAKRKREKNKQFEPKKKWNNSALNKRK